MPPRSLESKFTVTVVIPAFHAADHIDVAIRSVLDQPAIEACIIVVVDDQCQRTVDIASSYGPRVRAIMNPHNMGASASRNVGLAACVTPYVFFLDSDDWIEGPLLSSLLSAMNGGSNDISFGRFVVQIKDSGKRFLRPQISVSRDIIFTEWLVGKAYVGTVAILWRTKFVRDIGGWCESVSRNDDAELVLRGLLMGCRYGFSSEGLGVYLWHRSPHRVSKQASNIRDMLAIVGKLVAISSTSISREIVCKAAGEASYEIARTAFEEGDFVIGREALVYARSIGFGGHRGGVMARAITFLVGLEYRMRLRSAMKRARFGGPTSDWERVTAQSRNETA